MQDDTTRGLYGKYAVTKLSDPEATFEGFFLNYSTDPFVVPALRAYASACEAEFPLLAADLRKKAAQLQTEFSERVLNATVS